MRELKIDPELRDLLPPLTKEVFEDLENSIVTKGYDNSFPIMIWKNDIIVDGHNRYSICRKHNIDFSVGVLGFETKEEVIEWMLRIQLSRRALTTIQRIAITEKYRPYYEKQAQKNIQENGGDKKSDDYKESALVKLPKAVKPIHTSEKLAEIAGTSEKTYRMAAKVLQSDNEEVKQKVLSGEKSINAGYKEITKKDDIKPNYVKQKIQTENIIDGKPRIREEVINVCKELKTDHNTEYYKSLWDYKVDIIECLNNGFDRYYDGFVSTLLEMDGKVTSDELKECIATANNLVKKMQAAIDKAKMVDIKTEEY